ncbi:MAG: OmpA family protein [Myxococcales bacterium]|nr:OmpA family protein [Myxococcales bacterium]
MAATQGHLRPSAGLFLHYDHRPLVFVHALTGEPAYDELSYQVSAQLTCAIGLWDRFEFGLAMPLTFAQGTGDDALKFGMSPEISGGAGDLRVQMKAVLWRSGGMRLGFVAPLLLPTGDDAAYLGDGGIGFEPAIVASFQRKSWAVAANIRYRLRPSERFSPALSTQQITVDDEVGLSVGARFSVVPDTVDLIADGYALVNTSNEANTDRAGEVLAGARMYFGGGWTASVAAGPGVGVGMGVPVMRAVAHIGWRSIVPKPINPDLDGDGIPNERDVCPHVAENFNGVRDTDGCPEDEWVLRWARKRANQVRPRPKSAPLPKAPTEVAYDPTAGWRVTDPTKPPTTADKGDALPPLLSPGDDDGDGLVRADDVCPDVPEDKDGFEDGDGCPDPDNDGDNIPDDKDKCPNAAETKNGFKDDDGCPELVPVDLARLIGAIRGIHFETSSDKLRKRSNRSLKRLLKVLKRYPIVRVGLSGHTDADGDRKYNVDLSRRRAAAVRAWLIERGIAAARIVAEGYGPDRPVAKNDTAAHKAENRRVEFALLKASKPGEPPAAKRN